MANEMEGDIKASIIVTKPKEFVFLMCSNPIKNRHWTFSVKKDTRSF